ncbi:hypothetical protein OSTOST_01589, partial [Ostertagia ostertagi]
IQSLQKWSCKLEEHALELTKNCTHSVDESLKFGQNIYFYYDGDYIYVTGKDKLIERAVTSWTLPGEYYRVIRLQAAEEYTTYSNMVYQDIYEVGCNYIECPDENQLISEAVLMCIYNNVVPTGATLYKKGDGSGCTQDPKVCERLMPGATCGGVLCELPNQKSAP